MEQTSGWRFPKEILSGSKGIFSRQTLVERRKGFPLFFFQEASAVEFREAVRPPFSKGDEHWGLPQGSGAKPLLSEGERKALLMRSVKSAFALLLTKVTKLGYAVTARKKKEVYDETNN